MQQFVEDRKILEDYMMHQVLVETYLRIRDIDATVEFYTNLLDFYVVNSLALESICIKNLLKYLPEISKSSFKDPLSTS